MYADQLEETPIITVSQTEHKSERTSSLASRMGRR